MIDAGSIDDTERAVLAAALRDEDVRTTLVASATADWFQAIPHRALFGALRSLVAQNAPIDAASILRTANLGRNSISDGPFEATWLDESWRLATAVTAESLEKSHLPELRQAYQTRALQALSGALLERSEHASPSTVSVWLQERVEVIMASHDARPIQNDAEILGLMRNVESDDAFGPRTGIGELDATGFRLTPRRVTIVAGRPGHGKSVVGRQIAISAADQGVSAAVFALEEGVDGWRECRIAMLTGETYTAMATRKASLRSVEIFGQFYHAAFDRPIYVVDSVPSLTAFDIVAEMRRLKRHDPRLGVVVIDQMESIAGWEGAEKYQARDAMPKRILDEIVRGAKALDLHPVLLHQLNRDLEKGGRKREPVMSDLADTAKFEKIADNVLFVYRPNYDPVESGDQEPQPDDNAVLKFGKRRRGPKTRHLCSWNGPRMIVGNWRDPIVTEIVAELDSRGRKAAFEDFE
jgi:replicative DNA helicase